MPPKRVITMNVQDDKLTLLVMMALKFLRSKERNENFVFLMILPVGEKCKDPTCETKLCSTICGRIF
ncbi:hypothetical protein BTVI_55213 [Pitangus sulphuratus]|nr:hypothetical protein BTVI_55213 [Pitangus sulphuratus]